MVESLRDLLLKAGLKPSARQPSDLPSTNRHGANPKSARQPPGDRVGQEKRRDSHSANRKESDRADAPRQPPRPRNDSAEIDLARAYALRLAQEKREKAEAARIAAEKQRIRKEQRERVRSLIDGKVLNLQDAELPRHFEYGGKIRRIYVDADQLRTLNAGELGVVQLDGRYLLVKREVAEAVRACAPHHVALLPEPGAADEDEAAAASLGD